MDYLNKGDIFSLGTTLLQLIGENINEVITTKRMIFFRVVNCAIQIFVAVFICANFLHAKGGAYVNTVEDLTTVFHTLFKYLLLIYYKHDIRKILDDRTFKYWKHEDITDGKKEQGAESFSYLYRTGKLVQVVMLCVMVFCIYIIFFKPFFNANNTFLLDSKVPIDSIVLNAVVLFFHYYFFCIITAIVFGYDAIYLSLCVDLSAQVRLLKYKLKEAFDMDPTADANVALMFRVALCVDHHLFLLSVYNRMRRIYSVMLLFHYFVSLFTACFDMYESLIGEEAFADQTLKFLSVGVIIGQFAFYALPAEFVWNEHYRDVSFILTVLILSASLYVAAYFHKFVLQVYVFKFSDISYAIYTSKWYDKGPAIQKLTLLIMARSQRIRYFTGAGFLDINTDAFGSVIRKTFSMYAIIRNMFDR